ncbi:hypothetical protein OK015_00045 [Mycobacterium sp. Aquia_216]|uniref:hypothetical protein n=1 Tax=Mycobacterium sp. Aquia_216 TaxID=2991729 RepID=UPI00227CF171|nr:hypothetical protein [Mycobacterium sp. Aquia_216]WAJ44975.1 hypothetical protein OK015_00045 [Mycobacterium sp. Aquia_216]
MGRKVAIPWHVLFSLGAGGLYFLCVLPRWSELMGDTSRGLGMAGRIGAGALIALAALPVVFTQLRTRKPELGTPQMALTIRVWSIVAHVLAGVLIIGTAISEIWLSLDTAGQYLFGIYGAAAAIGLIGIFAFYLSFVAELPPPPPKPIKPKKAKRRPRRKKGDEADDEDAAHITDDAETEDSEIEESEAEDTEAVTADAEEAEEAPEQAEEPVGATTESAEAEPEPSTEEPSGAAPDDAEDETEEPRGGLQNRRPEGKGSHRMRRRRTRGGVALDE